jgi:hypothetical protein
MDQFTVTLLSNASTGEYPENNFFKFKNILNKELLLSPEEKWKVCLHSISCSSNIQSTVTDDLTYLKKRRKLYGTILARVVNKNSKDQKYISLLKTTNEDIRKLNEQISTIERQSVTRARFINVKSSIISPKYAEGNILSRFSAPEYDPVKSPTVTYQPKTCSYFDLATNTIGEIDIEITDAFGKPLRVTTAQPTVVVLKFKRMAMDSSEYFTLRVESENNPVNFRSKLPDSLIKDGQQNPWEMALTKISFPPSFYQFPKGYCTLALYKRDEKFDAWLVDQSNEEKMRAFMKERSVKSKLYPSQESSMNGKEFIVDLQNRLAELYTEEDWTRITIKKKNGKTEISVTEPIILQIPIPVGNILGINQNKAITLNGQIFLDLKPSKKFIGDFKIDPNLMIPRNLMLYADCVEPSLIGNIYGQYLTNIPVPIEDVNQKFLTTYEPRNLEFHPLQTGDLSNVHFQLTQTDGKFPSLSNENAQLFITLLFRKKK